VDTARISAELGLLMVSVGGDMETERSRTGGAERSFDLSVLLTREVIGAVDRCLDDEQLPVQTRVSYIIPFASSTIVLVPLRPLKLQRYTQRFL
jgi:hypothetical protein